MTTRMYWIAKIVLGSAGALLMLVSYWWLWPLKGLEVKNEPVELGKQVVEAGGTQTYHMHYCRYTDKPAQITRKFLDDIVFTTETQTVTSEKGCGERTVLVDIPKNLPPDKYKIKIIVQIKINPIRTITTEFTTQEFEVTKP